MVLNNKSHSQNNQNFINGKERNFSYREDRNNDLT